MSNLFLNLLKYDYVRRLNLLCIVYIVTIHLNYSCSDLVFADFKQCIADFRVIPTRVPCTGVKPACYRDSVNDKFFVMRKSLTIGDFSNLLHSNCLLLLFNRFWAFFNSCFSRQVSFDHSLKRLNIYTMVWSTQLDPETKLLRFFFRLN